jgi:hypothetical protein
MKNLSLAVALLLVGSTSQIRINTIHKDWDREDGATVTAADEYKSESLDGYQDAVDDVVKE